MNAPNGPILVVEDMPNVLELLEVTLTFKGYSVLTASNGEEALQVLERETPALVITDILMPIMDGYAFVYKMRTNPKTRDLPVMFLSATYVTQEDKDFAMNLGASRFVEKPIDTEEFLLTVAELLTQGPLTVRQPLDSRAFHQGYRERLEEKLRYKNSQIARTQRLILNLPPEQKPAFESMLAQAKTDRSYIEAELNDIYRILDELKKNQTL
jgi:CheY-like chemotaxis protein